MKRVRANKTLLRKTLAYIKAHPEHWNQGTWACGTSHCFGGWAAILAGWKHEPGYMHRMVKGENVKLLPEAATKSLRLNAKQAWALFRASNSMDTLERMVDNLCEGRDIETVG